MEESNLIGIYTEEGVAFDLGSRAKVIKGISDAMKQQKDDELIGLSLQEVVKLNDLTNREFAGLEFIAAE